MAAEEYKPGNFKDIFDSKLGKEIWDYLNTEPAKERMILTTELGHPAAEGIGDKLLEQFGDEVKKDRVKQATGHMIKYIMKEEGYKLVQRSVRCRKKTEVYTFASRYGKTK